MYFLNGGVGQLEALRKPLMVNKATYERAQATLGFQPMADRINIARRPVWFRTKTGLDVPYWNAPDFKDRDPLAPKSALIYQPYWMTNKSRTKLIQRPSLQIKPRSHVLYHLGTDEEDGLGKGFNPIKAVTRALTITKTSFQPKKIMGAVGSVAAVAAGGAAGAFLGPLGMVAGAALGPIIAPKVYSANSKTMRTLGMVATGIAVVAGAVVMGPAIAATLGPIVSSAGSMLGTAATGLGTFFKAFNALKPAHQQQAAQTLTAQQVADVQQGRATFDPNTGQLQYYQQPGQQPPGSLMVQGQPVAMPGPMPSPMDFGPSGGAQPVAQAGMMDMLGGLSPIALGLMIGVPLVMQMLLKKGK